MMNEQDITLLKNRCTYNPLVLLGSENILKLINYFEREIADRKKLADLRMKQDEEEKQLLQQQIERTLEERREELPAIPLEVAEAIISFRSNFHSDYTIIDSFLRERSGNPVVNDWSTRNAPKLMKAVINGYTVEQTLQERINEGVAQLARVWFHETEEVNELSTIEFASKVARFVQEVHAE